MENALLIAHVLAGILFVGPIAVAASMFPRYVSLPEAGTAPAERGSPVGRALHRVTRVYGGLAVLVPLLGLILAGVQERLSEVWVVIAMVLTAVAGALLVLRIAPMQRELLDDGGRAVTMRRLRATTGVFNLLWALVVALMIVRPGSAS